MPIGSFLGANVQTANTFDHWRERTNEILYALGTVVLVTDSTAGGNITTGNSGVNGHFFATTLRVGDTLSGGNNSITANLTITSNTIINSNVMIGATTPIQKLTLEGSQGARIAFVDTGTQTWSIGNKVSGVNGDRFVIGSETVGEDFFYIRPDGFVGIGVDTPDTELHVNGTITANNLVLSGTSNISLGTGTITVNNMVIENDLTIGGDTILSGNITANYFIGNGSTLTNVNATTLDGIDSTEFVRINHNIQIQNTTPTITLFETDVATPNKVRLILSNKVYATSIISNTDVFVATGQGMTIKADGANSHYWNIGGNTAALISDDGTAATSNFTIITRQKGDLRYALASAAGVAKIIAYAHFTTAVSGVTIHESDGVASISRLSTGRVLVTLSSARPDANYVVLAQRNSTADNFVSYCNIRNGTVGVSSFQLIGGQLNENSGGQADGVMSFILVDP